MCMYVIVPGVCPSLLKKLRDVNDATFNILSRGVAVLIPYQSKLKIRNPSWVVCWLQQSDVPVKNKRRCWLLMGIPAAMPGMKFQARRIGIFSPSPLFLYQCRWIYHWSTISIIINLCFSQSLHSWQVSSCGWSATGPAVPVQGVLCAAWKKTLA